MTDDSLTRLQAERNAAVADSWERAAAHRERVTRLVLDAADGASATASEAGLRLAVLGAGNGNDLDLKRLADRFAEVALVDIDGEALAGALRRQGCAGRPEFRLHGGRDLTGVWQQLSALREGHERGVAPDAEQGDRLMRAIPAWPGLPELGEFDVVASTCLLSQLVEGAIVAFGEPDPRGVDAAVALRLRHFRLVVEMLRAEGRGVIVTDFVSSATNPALPHTPPEELPAVLSQMIQNGNCFSALHPYRLIALFHEDPWLKPRVESPGCLQPWLWDFGPRHYAVTALPLRRTPTKAR